MKENKEDDSFESDIKLRKKLSEEIESKNPNLSVVQELIKKIVNNLLEGDSSKEIQVDELSLLTDKINILSIEEVEILDNIKDLLEELSFHGTKQERKIVGDTINSSDIIGAAKRRIEELGENFDEVLNFDLIRHLGKDIFIIGDKYIYNLESDYIYEIQSKFREKDNFILKGFGVDGKSSILVSGEFYVLEEGTNGIYKHENKNINKKYFYFNGEIYKIEKEYESWYIKLSKNGKIFMFDKQNISLASITENNIVSSREFRLENSDYEGDLYICDYFVNDNVNGKKVIELDNSYKRRLSYGNTKADTILGEPIFEEDSGLLLGYLHLGETKRRINSSITGEYLGKGELLDKDKINIDYGEFEELLKDIDISVIKREKNIKIIFTRDDGEQRMQTFDLDLLNKEDGVNIDILGVNFQGTSKEVYLSLKFKVFTKNNLSNRINLRSINFHTQEDGISFQKIEKNEGPMEFAKILTESESED